MYDVYSPPRAPSPKYQLVSGAATPGVLWPSRKSAPQYIVRSAATGAGAPLLTYTAEMVVECSVTPRAIRSFTLICTRPGPS